MSQLVVPDESVRRRNSDGSYYSVTPSEREHHHKEAREEKSPAEAYVSRCCGLHEFEVWFADGKKVVVPEGFIVLPSVVPVDDKQRRHSDGQIRWQSKLRDASGRALIKGDAVIAPNGTKPRVYQMSRVFGVVGSLLQLRFDDFQNHLVPANICYYIPTATYDLVVRSMTSNGERLKVPQIDHADLVL
uniref:Uncharacterized protein n=1 Tax=Plectus sambesii TaxID=2011161 RepID=A0A914VBB7_9BILA